MKRTNIYLYEYQIDKVAKLAGEKGVKSADLIREFIDFGLSISDSSISTPDIEYVRQKMTEKKGEEVGYQEEFKELAREKAVEYRDRQNNSARITSIVEGLKRLEETIAELVYLIKSEYEDKNQGKKEG